MKKRDYKYLGTENNIVFGTTGSEDQFSFFPSSSETFNEDVDKFYFERDDFDRNYFDDKEPETVFSTLESDFGGAMNRRQDFEDEDGDNPFTGLTDVDNFSI